MRFSERYGYKPVRESIQKDSIDDELKKEIWNNLDIFIFSRYTTIFTDENDYIPQSDLDILVSYLWRTFFKETLDTTPTSLKAFRQDIRDKILKTFEWHQIYSFIEAILERYPHYGVHESSYFSQAFIKQLNISFKTTNAAYRIINNQITEITSEQEIQSIEEALQNTNLYSGVQQHLNQALQLISDRINPNYSKSIHDSISAVEGLARAILKDESITLGKAIPKLRDQLSLHTNISESLNKLYAYTCDQNGIRHGATKESNLDYMDAKFMLVACTNFINYLMDKTKDQN